MAAPTQLLLGGNTYVCQPGETVLDALLRQGVSIPHDCRKQTCLTCLLRSLDGPPPAAAQAPLKATLTVQHYFLACACRPARDMAIALPSETLREEIAVRVAALNRVSNQVLEIVLHCERPLPYRGGQSVILLNQDHIGKSFAIASPTSQIRAGRIELQVERMAGCCFCEWLHDQLRVGDRLRVFGPFGLMFHVPGDPRQGIVLAGWGGALGGLLGILQDVFEHSHSGPVYLFHGAQDAAGLYLVDEIREIEQYFPNFRYVGCVPRGAAADSDTTIGDVHQVMRRLLPDLGGWRAYLAGPRNFVDRLRRQTYLDGASIKEIFFDVTSA